MRTARQSAIRLLKLMMVASLVLPAVRPMADAQHQLSARKSPHSKSEHQPSGA
jgi:hypothetical protein